MGRKAPSANRLEGGLANTSVLVVEPAPQKGCCQHLCPQGEPQLPPASLGVSPRSVSGYDPGSFQITASVLGLRMCEVLSAPFKSRVSVSYNPMALPYARPSGLQSQAFCGLVFLVQDPRAGESDEGTRLLTLWGEPLQL